MITHFLGGTPVYGHLLSRRDPSVWSLTFSKKPQCMVAYFLGGTPVYGHSLSRRNLDLFLNPVLIIDRFFGACCIDPLIVLVVEVCSDVQLLLLATSRDAFLVTCFGKSDGTCFGLVSCRSFRSGGDRRRGYLSCFIRDWGFRMLAGFPALYLSSAGWMDGMVDILCHCLHVFM